MVHELSCMTFPRLMHCKCPSAIAVIAGNDDCEMVSGTVKFYKLSFGGVLIESEIFNLPHDTCEGVSFYGFHIHEIGDCGNNFANTGAHYDTNNNRHPYHTGDMPPLISNNGYSWMSFYHGSLCLEEIIGKSVIIHSKPDDFTSQPSGNSGSKIACGVIYN